MPGNDCPEPEIFFLLKFSDLRNDRCLAIAWPASFYFFERGLPFSSRHLLIASFTALISSSLGTDVTAESTFNVD
ncbi:hypothetical protein RG963_00260 [Methanosarcina sp. Z-7115]|uniref:Uncharacterized protein n=1 Tax=Methanosarcina baikalica TaxID=3073890 RepID=A0ABU2CWX7_9EURY|nr:hypothetical protein [Methanosarcina sp. Z-7115]MDR7664237.1 hypothetical protein [Methanosarcina sp. Z-7115]